MIINMEKIIQENDRELKTWLSSFKNLNAMDNRSLSYHHRDLLTILTLSVNGWIEESSNYYGQTEILEICIRTASLMLRSLNPDGTVNSVNLASPPDTAFITERVGDIIILLEKERKAAAPLIHLLMCYLKRTGKALIKGGVHTPNHRWVISSALSYCHRILNDSPAYTQRIEQWLAEGIDMDEDGVFSERSTAIYSPVTANALIDISENTGREDLLEKVRIHLNASLYFLRPDGKISTVLSRRQDSMRDVLSPHYLFSYLYMAQKEKDGLLSGAASLIYGKTEGKGENRLLTAINSNRIDLDKVPDPLGPVPPRGDRFFKESRFFTSSREDFRYSIFGGTDSPSGFASGKSCNSSVLSVQKGGCSIEALRIAPMFFNTGYFRADSMSEKDGSFILEQYRSVPYYDSLNQEKCSSDGDYSLTSADRYWSKLDFPSRKKTNIQFLDTRVTITRMGDGLELAISCTSSAPVPIALEIVFPQSGNLAGKGLSVVNRAHCKDAIQKQLSNCRILKKDFASFTEGEDSLFIGPGLREHPWLPVENLDSFKPLGEDLQDRQMVYIPFFSPGNLKIQILIGKDYEH